MSPEAEERALGILERFHTHLNRILHQGVADGSFRPDLVADASSESLFHMIGSTRMLIAHGRDPHQVARQTARLVRAAVRSNTLIGGLGLPIDRLPGEGEPLAVPQVQSPPTIEGLWNRDTQS